MHLIPNFYNLSSIVRNSCICGCTWVTSKFKTHKYVWCLNI